jgi:hypothetical protein
MRYLRRFKLGLVSCGLLAATAPAQALNIVPTFLGSWTQTQKDTIDAAAQDIDSLYSNNVTVNILFQFGNTGLGQSETGFYGNSYTNYTNLLRSDFAANPINTDLGTAIANLAKGNSALPVASTSAQLRALGLTAATPCFNASGSFVSSCGQQYDGVITFSNSTPLTFTTNGAVPPYNGSNPTYSALGVSEHEIDEILGTGGAGSMIDGGLYGVYYGSLDLYRYSAPNTPSYTNNTSQSAYFSIDGGVTKIAGFNHDGIGDYADWGPYGSTPCNLIQNAYACNNVTPETFARGVPEDVALQAVGYNPVAAVPEPSTWAMLLLGFFGLASFGHRRAKAAATA